MKQELKDTWVKALRSGKYEQGRGRLRSSDGKMCCLGVLCDIVDPTKWGGYRHTDVTGDFWNGQIEFPDCAHLEEEMGLPYASAQYLAELNDNGSTFAEIADYIEENIG